MLDTLDYDSYLRLIERLPIVQLMLSAQGVFPLTLEKRRCNEDYLSAYYEDGTISIRVPREGAGNTPAALITLLTHEVAHAMAPVDSRDMHGTLFKDLWAAIASDLLGVDMDWPRTGRRYWSCDKGFHIIESMVKKSLESGRLREW